MAISILLGTAVAVWWISFPFASVISAASFVIAAFLIYKASPSVFSGPQLLLAASLPVFSFSVPFSLLSLALVLFGIAMLAFFRDADNQDLAPPFMARIRFLLLLALILWAIFAFRLGSFHNSVTVLSAAAIVVAVVGYAGFKTASAENILAGRVDDGLVRAVVGFAAALVGGELFLLLLFLPFAAYVSGILLAVSMWVFFEVMAAAKNVPFALARASRAAILGFTTWVALVLTAPWPSGIVR
ncbi:MAG: hypothetical protein A2806_03780 [Candidatus Terrybacteria bacterium RIFCSPHIGHO2_01_FULL_48_17]|uniref:Uncharacterized protein n=1 Tax=Candidatus Terrybacteria bacterium RIFCSPHIGHO2_01_FULL_48_17 TaxID=1802362 RepID=A0A1G2PIG3_9BACT|nr:MAG: hypothetical protein A2806_03780 [Candidatus Terrybacteria bacterium RIFCSPHIGHO2_01_FULL_48_17]OHA53921.1 MAG: hypothetical protein A3A30_03840 [Candidatus Terrybacteria bacterium RIFCSPLOWO2_01_FULL_48_14]